MKSHRIEDLKVWSKSMALVKEVYLVTAELPNEERFGLLSQIKDVQFQYLQILQKEQEEIIRTNFINFLELRLVLLTNYKLSYNY